MARDGRQATLVILGVLLALLALAAVAGAVYQAIETSRDRRRFPPPGRFVQVNAGRMHIHLRGEGTPTVIFESGMAASCLNSTLVHPLLAHFASPLSPPR